MRLSLSPEQTVRWATQAYRGLLDLYPAGFRAEYGQEMQELFEARCLEAYQTASGVGVSRWLLKILVGEVIGLYKEYLDMMADLFENDREARRTLPMGMFFLAGTWIALFFLTVDSAAGLVPGAALVLINAMLVARSLLRSEHMGYVPGMAAMTNTVLVAGLMAVQTSLQSLPAAAVASQLLLIGLHGVFLWRLHGENLTGVMPEMEKGE